MLATLVIIMGALALISWKNRDHIGVVTFVALIFLLGWIMEKRDSGNTGEKWNGD